MYAWLWRCLPGPTAARLVLVGLFAGALVALLFGLVFPWFDHALGIDDAAIGRAR